MLKIPAALMAGYLMWVAAGGCKSSDPLMAPNTAATDPLPANAYPQLVLLDGLEQVLVKERPTIKPPEGDDTLLVRIPMRSVTDQTLHIQWQIVFSTDDGEQLTDNPVWQQEAILPRTRKVLEARALTRRATKWNVTIRAVTEGRCVLTPLAVTRAASGLGLVWWKLKDRSRDVLRFLKSFDWFAEFGMKAQGAYMNILSPAGRIASLCAVVLTVGLFCSQARGRNCRPEPPTGRMRQAPASGKKGGPITDYDRNKAATTVDDAAVDAFKKAYRGAGRPKMLFLVGVDKHEGTRGPREGRGPVGSGQVKGPGIGENLAVFDDTGITEVLETGIGAIINDDGRVRMVDLESLSEKDKRDQASHKQNDEDAAIDAMARKVNADLVFYIKFTPLHGKARGVNDASFRCISELKNVNTATKVSLAAFDWDGPIDNQNAKRYCVALSQVFCERFVKIMKAGGGLRPITVKIVQLPASVQATAIRRLIRKIDGVDGNVDVTSGNGPDGGEATFEFEFDGDVADFLDALIPKVASDLSVKLGVTNQDKNNLLLSASAAGDSRPEWFELTDPKDNPVKDRFIAAYKKNPLKVALAINWMVDARQWGGINGDWTIVMLGDPRLANTPFSPASVELERLSSQVSVMFKDLGVEVVNPLQVRSILSAQGDKAKALHNDRDLAVILGASNTCDVICLGLATAPYNDAARIPYDFKLTNCNNGDLVGAITWPVDERLLKSTPKNRGLLAKEENRTRYIAGQMLLAIERSLGGGKIMTAEVRHAADLATVQAVVEKLKKIEEITADGVRYDNGLGTFTIRYSGAYEDISGKINDAVGQIKSVKVVEVNPSALRLDAKAAE